MTEIGGAGDAALRLIQGRETTPHFSLPTLDVSCATQGHFLGTPPWGSEVSEFSAEFDLATVSFTR